MSDDRTRPRHEDPADDAGLRRRIEALLPTMIKRTVSTGVGAAQLTEDMLRGMVGELKLPREAVGYIVEVADNTRKEVVRVAAREFREFLESANLTEELVRLLTSVSFEVRTEVRFVPTDQKLKPSVRSHVRVKGDGPEAEVVPDEPEKPNILRESGLVDVLDDFLRAGASDLADRLIGGRRGVQRPEEALQPPPTAPPPAAPKKRRTARKPKAPSRA